MRAPSALSRNRDISLPWQLHHYEIMPLFDAGKIHFSQSAAGCITTIETTIGAIVVIETDAMTVVTIATTIAVIVDTIGIVTATALWRDRYSTNPSRNQYND